MTRSPLTARPATAALGLGLAYAGLLLLAFPPVQLLGFAALLPLPALLASRLPSSTWKLSVAFAAGSAPAWAILHGWIFAVTAAGYPILIVVLSLWPALLVWLTRRIARPVPWWLAAPLAWSAVEMLRGQLVFHGYPWYLAAQPLAPLLPQPFGVVGVYGVGFGLALLLALAIDALAERRATPGRIVAASIALGVLAASLALPRPVAEGDPVTVAVVQTNVPQDNKLGWSLEERARDFARFIELTREAAAASPELIVWPETMFPGETLDRGALATLRGAGLVYPDGRPATFFADALLAVQEEIGVPMLVGAHGFDAFRVEFTESGVRFESDAEYNSAILLAGGRPTEPRYDKLHLTPFGEIMPYISWSERLEEMLLGVAAPGMAFNLSEGNRPTRFEIDTPSGPFRFATPICFEATNPAVGRRLAYAGGERRVHALIQLTNDGWYKSWPGGRESHQRMTAARAAELGVPIVRAANTGVSSLIDAGSRVVQAAPEQEAGVFYFEVDRPTGAGTIYGRLVGDAVGWLGLLGTFAALALSFRRKKTPKEPA